jgi:hypothetical protein
MLPCRLRGQPCIDRNAPDREELVAHHSALQQDAAAVVHAVEFEHVLGDIDAEVSIAIAALLPVAGSQPLGGGRAVHPISCDDQASLLPFIRRGANPATDRHIAPPCASWASARSRALDELRSTGCAAISVRLER